MATNAQEITTQDEAMMVTTNWELSPHVNQNASTMDSQLKDFTRMNPPMFFGSKVKEYHQVFPNNIYKILSAIG